MRNRHSTNGQATAARVLLTLGIATALIVCFVLPARADKMFDAREQFARAVKLRTELEGYLEKDRTLANYKQTVAAYHKVYLISPQADDATAAIVAQGELYQEMGRIFDPKYYQSAIDAYTFLIRQYPGSRYRGNALFSIAQIQKDNLNAPDEAKGTYKEYLKQFPRSEKSADARAALKENAKKEPVVQDVKAPAPQPDLPELKGQRAEPRLSDKGRPALKDLQAWNTPNSARIVVTLDGSIKYDSTRIPSPDRIYFDLYKAQVSPKFSRNPPELQSGLLKSIRLAQNKPDVVRIVLDADGPKDYSAYLLANPYRLVIELHTQGANITKNIAIAAPAPALAPVSAPDRPPLVASTGTLNNGASISTPANTPPVAPMNPNSGTSSAMPAGTSSGTSAGLGDDASDTQAAPKPATKAGNRAAIFGPKPTPEKVAVLEPPPEPKPTRDGQRSLTRALGLKISRIVIDAGHGGHDTGTIGPHGLMEKDLCLDIALRLGSLIEKKLPGADVVYTRKDDTFIPLEERTAIANDTKADLFISIHANSSHDPSARGVETYYLNFATSADSMEVASRENANSQESLHDLQDLIKKIARNEKIDESKELAGDIQDTLTERMQLVSRSEKNRGVKKAPFIVLIGANMPSVLSEIAFVSNPNDEKLLRKTDQRQRIADGLFRGISTYLENLNSLTLNKQKLISDNHLSDSHLETGAVASAGNPK